MAKKKYDKKKESFADRIDKWLDDSRIAARKATADALQQHRTPPTLQQLVQETTQFTADRVKEALPTLPPQRPIACCEGCSWCCNFLVVTSAVEVLTIAEYIRNNFSPSEVDAVKARLAQLVQQTQGMDDVQRSRSGLSCALLVNGRCSVYPVRPLPCAGYNSYDASMCERGVKGEAVKIPWYGIQIATYLKVADGVREGLGQAGLSGAPLDLCAALRIALDDPNAAERYLNKEPIFESAKVRV